MQSCTFQDASNSLATGIKKQEAQKIFDCTNSGAEMVIGKAVDVWGADIAAEKYRRTERAWLS
jgi:hypothetical protein